jgi:hypothetical protein
MDYFQTASLDVADAMFGIVKETLRKRHAVVITDGCLDAGPFIKRKRRPCRTKAEMAAAVEAA